MKKHLFSIMALLCMSVSAFAEMTKSQLQELYVSFLKTEGFSPTVDKDGDVVFKREGSSYYFNVDASDQEFVQLVLPNIWSIDSKAELQNARAAAALATRSTKVAKCYVRSDDKNVSIAVELFVDKPEDFKKVFRRSLSSIGTAKGKFCDEMKERL
jgi:hypothetical protein